jgi:hypothetical protein
VQTIAYQPELSPALPVVYGNVDYQAFRALLIRINELLERSGVEAECLRACRQQAQATGRTFSAREAARFDQQSVRALRCTLARQLTETPYRAFSLRLADSPLLQWFCRIDRLDGVTVPGKSALERYEKCVPEALVRALVHQLNRAALQAPAAEGQALGLLDAVALEACFLDTTCVPANIHFPVDWVLLRDAVRTLMKAVSLIRQQGLKHRMAEPESFLRQMNRQCLAMTQCRRRPDAPRQRKRVLRRMKRLSRLIGAHARRHRDLLERGWPQTAWSRRQAAQVRQRIEGVLERLPEAIRQAHERVIGGRLVDNQQKLLSLYEREIHVIVRGKAEAEVEFGNSLLLAEQPDGLLLDWQLLRDSSPGDTRLLEGSLERIHTAVGQYPAGVGTDRGFDSAANRRGLEAKAIFNAICPRSPLQLKERMKEEDFRALQQRRGQTEGRVGIFKNVFLGRPLRSKGFAHRELAVAWAVLAHNLWIIAELPQGQTAERAA